MAFISVKRWGVFSGVVFPTFAVPRGTPGTAGRMPTLPRNEKSPLTCTAFNRTHGESLGD